MKEKEVLLLLTDKFADWEASYAISTINSTEAYDVRTIAIDTNPKVSIGGLRTAIDYSIKDYDNFENLAMIIIPGGSSWKENRYDEIASFVKKVNNLNIPIAAICGATIFLAKHGILNDVKHTGDSLEYFKEQLKNEKDYKGQDNFIETQVVNDKGFITANETAAVELAYEIFKVLKIADEKQLKFWYDTFKKGMFK